MKKAALTINMPGDTAEAPYPDDEDYEGGEPATMVLWDYRAGEARTVTGLGVSVSGPTSLSLGVRLGESQFERFVLGAHRLGGRGDLLRGCARGVCINCRCIMRRQVQYATRHFMCTGLLARHGRGQRHGFIQV